MLSLPKSTELKKQLPKTAIYAKFNMNNAQKERFDADVSRINIIAEISPATVNVAKGETVSSIYVVQVILKRRDFDEKTIIQLSKLIDQNMILALEFENMTKLAIYHTKLLQSEWYDTANTKIELKGLNLDTVWENLVKSIAFDNEKLERWNEKLSLTENIIADEKRAKIEKEIARLEKQARAEKQPKKKFELVQKINELKARKVYDLDSCE